MAIKKAKLNFSEVAKATPIVLDSGVLAYPIRFRLTSDDKNRKSQWSPMFLVIPAFPIDIILESLDGGTVV